MHRQLMTLYDTLLAAYGPQGWWPADGPTEIVVGAVLVQHATWPAAARAVAALRCAGLLDFARLADEPRARLAALVRPAGMPRVKARRIRSVARWFSTTAGGDVSALAAVPTADLRRQLLRVDGIGPETADCILLYACARPTFVVDAYTRRVLVRHRIIETGVTPAALKQRIETALPADVDLFNEFHALLVAVGKAQCRRRARCTGCPLEHLPHDAEAD